MSAKFPMGGGGAGPFLARSLQLTKFQGFSFHSLQDAVQSLYNTLCLGSIGMEKGQFYKRNYRK